MSFNHFLFKNIFYLTLKLRREWFIPYLIELEKSQYWTSKELEQHQIARVNRLLAHAKMNTAYYRDRIPSSISSLSELTKLPLLDKEEIRNNVNSFMWRKGLHQRLKTSGGSTGAPVTLLKDSVGMAQELAATWRGYGWAGVNIGDRQARFWGVPRNNKDKWRAALIDFVCNRQRISAFGYDESYFTQALKSLNFFDPDYLYGYVSILREFADFISENADCLPKIRPKAIITTSEILTELDREKLTKVFGSKVYDEYGCGEIGTITHECEHGSRHINSENMVVEILSDDGSTAGAGEIGEIVVTDLTNYSMPLIRYRLKDFGTLAGGPCSCGRTLPSLEKIHGRQYDTLANSKGKNFHGEFFLYIVEDAKKNLGFQVNGIQFLQRKDLSIEVRVVCSDKNLASLKNFVEGRLKRDFDHSLQVRFLKTEKILREPSGKLRVVKRL